jgi:nucleoside-diphosphate-sugar epimerase
MSNQKLLVTGGSGFIGNEVITIATSIGLQVMNLDLKPPPVERANATWIQADVRNVEELRKVMHAFSPEYILHLASDVDVNYKSMKQYETTVEGTRNIAKVATELPDLRRFVHISTQFVVEPGIVPTSEKFWKPYTLYGEAKAESERIIWSTGLEDFYILRPTIIWGPRHPSFAQQIWKYIAERKYLHPATRRPLMRTYGYVSNVADQMVSFAYRDVSVSDKRVFYLGDQCINYDEWVDAFALGLTGAPARRIPKSLLKIIALGGEAMKKCGISAPIDMGRYFRMTTASPYDIESTFAAVGNPKTSFDEGIARTLSWLKTADPNTFGAPAPN